MCSNGYLKPLAVESHICKRDAFEKDYFDCDIDADARAVAAAEKMFSKPVEPVMRTLPLTAAACTASVGICPIDKE